MYECYIPSHSPKFTNPAKYIKAKVKILKRDFCIKPTKEEEEHLYELATQISIDNAIQSIIDRHWN
jgi:hypothetical protein